jgi:hypothetical protein
VGDRARAIEREVDRHALTAQAIGDRTRQPLVIFDDKYTHRHSMSPGGHSGVTIRVTITSPAGAYNGAMNSHPRLSRAMPPAAVAVAAALLVSACGASKKPPASSVSGHGSGTKSAIKAAYQYSACMRTHGVTNFEDPHVHTSGNSVQIAVHVDPAITGAPAFKSAQRACAHILPNGGNGPSPAQIRARTDAILAFAKCMRKHGFPRFPDPDSQGRLTPAMLTAAGIDLHQPAIRPAAYTCLPLTHGLLTRADVNQAVANPNGSGAQSGSAGG